MGCCFSSGRNTNDSGNRPAGVSSQHIVSSQNINTFSPHQSSSAVNDTPRASHSRRPLQASETDSVRSIAPNSPLKAIPSARRSHTPHKEIWTLSRLRREREEYFDTRTSGRSETWLVVRSITTMIRDGNVSEAQAMLDAAGCTCPTGSLWKGVWDELGAYYPVPEWVVVEPEELADETDDDEGKGTAGTGEPEDVDEEGRTAQERKDEKGKGRAMAVTESDAGKIVKVRARLSDRSTDVVIKIGQDEKISVLVRRIKTAAQLPVTTKVRIGYLGRILPEQQSLSSQNWNPQHIVNALVFETE
ncbi:hypothetical protein EJ05DRAFT_482604 [Pseudovirgaria hyperparasitica]|uniref:DC-UbP/UBTD2 N-terminal domain-containing protein n=1 Tax=Pseudovirgaria hyperparasitica TaxID=470096 RepID=A0A6A6WIE2_9PEZI|nr:uncharacterized protein EJ05DRAFT_482604 [Pseudovirgaria hyperparasitica]KAF2761766.1 hypothetical protein EJ05DRAFT_482604 [Pseudovirgaria hyperparasitica]